MVLEELMYPYTTLRTAHSHQSLPLQKALQGKANSTAVITMNSQTQPQRPVGTRTCSQCLITALLGWQQPWHGLNPSLDRSGLKTWAENNPSRIPDMAQGIGDQRWLQLFPWPLLWCRFIYSSSTGGQWFRYEGSCFQAVTWKAQHHPST